MSVRTLTRLEAANARSNIKRDLRALAGRRDLLGEAGGKKHVNFRINVLVTEAFSYDVLTALDEALDAVHFLYE